MKTWFAKTTTFVRGTIFRVTRMIDAIEPLVQALAKLEQALGLLDQTNWHLDARVRTH
jgi:hypothetical protein